jgi:oligosaccharide reducing-end xylanase
MEEFDRLWKWTKTYMYLETGTHQGYFAWSCGLDGKKNSQGPAPDGEEYFAMALFFASRRWGMAPEFLNIPKKPMQSFRPACTTHIPCGIRVNKLSELILK